MKTLILLLILYTLSLHAETPQQINKEVLSQYLQSLSKPTSTVNEHLASIEKEATALNFIILDKHAHAKKYHGYLLQLLETTNLGQVIGDSTVEVEDENILQDVFVWDVMKYGKPYQCVFSEEEKEKKVVDDDSDVPVHAPEYYLMKHLDKPLYKWEGWWTYEFDFHKNVLQYHLEGTKKTAEFSLGQYSPAKNKSANERFDHYIEEYKGGTVCDLSGEKRSSAVIYKCNRAGSESPSCRYKIIIGSPHLCNHPKYAPTKPEAEHVFCFSGPLPSYASLKQHYASNKEEKIQMPKAKVEPEPKQTPEIEQVHEIELDLSDMGEMDIDDITNLVQQLISKKQFSTQKTDDANEEEYTGDSNGEETKKEDKNSVNIE